MSASAKVFETPELLEIILLELPIQTLLRAQSVDKTTWKSTIDGSPKLQRALFFKSSLSDRRAIDKSASGVASKDVEAGKIFRNPLLEPLFEFFKDLCFIETGTIEGEMRQKGGLHKSWLEPTATWRRMCHTQPPLQDCFTVQSTTLDDEGHGRRQWVDVSHYNVVEGKVYNMLMGEVVDNIDSTIANDSGRSDSEDTCIHIRLNKSIRATVKLEKGSDLELLIHKQKRQEPDASA